MAGVYGWAFGASNAAWPTRGHDFKKSYLIDYDDNKKTEYRPSKYTVWGTFGPNLVIFYQVWVFFMGLQSQSAQILPLKIIRAEKWLKFDARYAGSKFVFLATWHLH